MMIGQREGRSRQANAVATKLNIKLNTYSLLGKLVAALLSVYNAQLDDIKQTLLIRSHASYLTDNLTDQGDALAQFLVTMIFKIILS